MSKLAGSRTGIMDDVEVLGVQVDNISSSELLDEIYKLTVNKKKEIISHVNIHGLNVSYKLPWYREFLNKSAINFCDGDGVRLGAKLVGKEIVEKITYNRLIWRIADLSQREGLTWYLMGSKEDTINRAVEILRTRYPGLIIVGYRDGFVKSADDLKDLIEDMSHKRPDIFIDGMGMPIQEKFLMDNFDSLSFKVAMTAGACFEYVAGDAKMTPNIFYKLKLEWFFRFLNEPKRLFRRYFVGNLIFFLRILKQKLIR